MKKSVFIILGIVIILALVGLGIYFWQKTRAKKIVINDLPIMVLADKTAVYREMTIDQKGNIEKTITLQNLGDQPADNLEIYEAIPKEIAPSAKDLTFSVQPQIIEDDPVVLWKTCGNSSDPTACSNKGPGFFELGKNILKLARNAGLNYLTDTCNTKTAKDWIKTAGYKEGDFFGCDQYIKYIERTIEERTTTEWQNKSANSQVTRTIPAGSAEYKQIQNQVKKITTTAAKKTAAPTTSKKSEPCQYCSTIKCRDCKTGFDVCRTDKTGCTSCNTDADCLDTHFCSGGAGCFLKESEIHKRAKNK